MVLPYGFDRQHTIFEIYVLNGSDLAGVDQQRMQFTSTTKPAFEQNFKRQKS